MNQRPTTFELFADLPPLVHDKVRPLVETSVHFSSETDEWPTPQDFFDKVNAELGPFDLDPCATAENAKCARFYTREQDGLRQPWAPARVWMNPPYGRTIGLWMHKAFIEAQKGAVVVCLVPARTDTKWWHDFAARGEVRFCRGRQSAGENPVGTGGGMRGVD